MRIRIIGKTRLIYSVLFLAAAASASIGSEVILFSDDFDVDSSADWNINASSSDTSAIFAFDYSSIGVPPSPNGGGTTLGLRMAANIDSPDSSEALTLSPVGESFSGTYLLKFDMWMNFNGPFPAGGVGAAEFLCAGIGYDDVTVNLGAGTGSGGWFALTGDGGSSRDYRAYQVYLEQYAESGQFFAGTSSVAQNGSDPYYAGFGGIDVDAAVPYQQTLYPLQTGTTQVGSAGFEWHEVTIFVNGSTALWSIDGLPIAELDPALGPGFDLEGNISIGYDDMFSSVSDNPDVSFGLIDNLVVIKSENRDHRFSWHTIDSGGGTSSGNTYQITGTIGQPDPDFHLGGPYELLGGFWTGGPLCIVNLQDFAAVAAYWLDGPCDESNNWCDGADLNQMNDVDIVDLTILGMEWLDRCPFNWPLR